MKLQENTPTPTNPQPKQDLSNGTNFKQKIPKYINEINLSNFFLDQNQLKTQPLQITKKLYLETQKNVLRSQHSSILETLTRFYLFLGKSIMENYSQIIVYDYMKSNGNHNSLEINGIKGEISCLQAVFCLKRNPNQNKKGEIIKNPKKSEKKYSQQNTFEIVLLIGTVQGYLKTVRFSEIDHTKELKSEIESLKLDYWEIIEIKALERSYYKEANVCLVLSITNRVYLVNFDSMMLISYFLPTIMSCEVALGLSINYQEQYFVQTCEGGYIVFWDINEKILELINKSSKTNSYQQDHAEENKQQLFQTCQAFKSKDIYHCISPLNIFHSATISGLKFCQLYGNLLLLITQNGVLKLLAINKSNLSQLCQNQYTALIQYQIHDGQLITDAKFFQQTMEIFIVKSCIFNGIFNKSGFQKYIPVKEYHINSESSKRKNKVQLTKVYKPLKIKNYQNNILPQRQRSKSNENQQGKCYFQRIIINSCLEIEKVDKIYPSQYIDCIESLQMSENKDIVVLRAREFYLIGASDLFKSVQIN